jgi:predicted amidohydrolase
VSEFVACTVQQQVKIYDIPLEYQADIFQFLQMAQAKQAKLVVLPALSPLMLVPPLASQTKIAQLRKKQDTRGGIAGLVGKLFSKSQEASGEEQGGIHEEVVALLENHPGEIYDAYIDLFSAAALKYQMTIVAGSFYLRENEGVPSTHVSYVFGPNGMVLGRQEKIHLTGRERKFCQAGQVLQVIETPIGKLGILIEEDVLYPECSRILAYNGVDMLINLSACSGKPTFNQMRNAFLARIDENSLLGLQSCLVGNNLIEPEGDRLSGKAALLQPFQLSPYGDGVLYEVGSYNVEGFIAEPVSLEALREYWVQARDRVRQDMQMAVFSPLVDIYRRQRTLDQVYWNPDDSSHQNRPAGQNRVNSSTSGGLVSPFATDED